MIEKENYKALLPEGLYAQIEELVNSFKEIQKDVQGLAQNGNVPDSTMQLNDVLKSTEEATHTILDSTNAILALTEGAWNDESKAKISELAMQIFVSCSFQDITGQRIKKVLTHLTAMEAQIKKLSSSARAYMGEPEPEEISVDDPQSLLNGPQLSGSAPNQDDIDKLFSSF